MCARNKPTAEWKRAYEEKVMETWKKVSIAKAEMKRIKLNREQTKRGRKNRELLKMECKTLSVGELVITWKVIRLCYGS